MYLVRTWVFDWIRISAPQMFTSLHYLKGPHVDNLKNKNIVMHKKTLGIILSKALFSVNNYPRKNIRSVSKASAFTSGNIIPQTVTPKCPRWIRTADCCSASCIPHESIYSEVSSRNVYHYSHPSYDWTSCGDRDPISRLCLPPNSALMMITILHSLCKRRISALAVSK